MSAEISNDEVFERVRVLIADEGAEWADGYELFLADNRTFDPYWQDGVDAIRDNTVSDLVFGRECMIKVGRKHLEDNSFNSANVLGDLAIVMDHAVRDMVKKKD